MRRYSPAQIAVIVIVALMCALSAAANHVPAGDGASIEAYGASSMQVRDSEFADPDAATKSVENSAITIGR